MKKTVLIFCLTCFTIFNSLLYAQQEEPILVINPQGHSAMIWDVMFTPDGATLISVSDDKTIRLWDVATGDLIKTIRGQIGAGHEGKLFAGALAPDGKVLAVGGYPSAWGIRLFNIQSGEQIGLLKGHTNVIHALAFSPDGRRLASGSFDKTVRIWDVSRQQEFAKLEGHTDSVYGVAFSPDGKKVASASFDGTLRLWNVGQIANLTYREMKRHTAEVRCVAFAPNGRYIVSGGFDDKILLWDGNGNFVKEIDELSNDVNTVSISADSRKVIAVSGMSPDRNAYVYSIPSGEKITTFSKHNNSVVASAFYGNNLIATAGGDDNDIYIWDANSGTVKTHILGKGRTVLAVAFGEGLNVALGNSSDYVNNSKRGSLEKSFNFSAMSLNPQTPNESNFQRTRANYSGKSFEKVGDYELKIVGDGTIKNNRKFDGRVRSYTFTPDGNVVVGSSFSLKLYRSDGAFIRQFIGHTGVVWAVSVEPSGRILASASSDQTIKLWNLQSGALLATLFVTNDNEWICWTPQGYYAASAGGEKYIGWQINQGMDKAAEYYPVYTFRNRFLNKELVIRTIELASFDKALAEYNARPVKKIVPETITSVLPPEVTWLSPGEYYTKTSTNSIAIKARVTSSDKITTLKIQVNGGTVATTSQIKTSSTIGQFGKIIEYRVPLIPQRNEIRIYAENTNAFTTSNEIVVFYESLDWMKPNLYMVSIGISSYLREDQNLKYADADARSMSRIYRDQRGKLFKKVEIKELYDANATRTNIIKAFQWLEDNTTQKDVAIVFLSAHGYNEREKFYILPHDGNPDELRISGVDWSVFQETLGNLPSRILLFLDTCHSGKLGSELFAMKGRVDNTEALRELASVEYGVVIMAASTGAELSIERAEWGHGAFTKALIEGLELGKADYSGDGIIHLNELDQYVSERVKQLTNGKQHATTQKPSSISRFPIFQYE